MDAKVIIKALKILYSVSKVAMNMGHVNKVKDLLTQEPCASAIFLCQKMKVPNKGNTVQDVQTINKWAIQLMELVEPS
jgi:hypothetical protein